MKQRGFSLVEILMGMALFSALIVTSTAIMMSSVRGSRKAAAVALAKTEGAYALKVMEQKIRYAADIACPGSGLNLDLHTVFTNQAISYYLDTGNKQLMESGTSLTSKDVVVTQGNPLVCANVFTCTSATSVNICFVIETINGVEVTDRAGINGILFQTTATLVNTEQ